MHELRKNHESWTFGLDPKVISKFLSKYSINLLEDLFAIEYRKQYMPHRHLFLKGYEFYHVAFGIIE